MEKLSKIRGGILALLIIVALVAVISGTYARYQSTGTANAVVNIAKWHVELDTQDISTVSKTVYPTLNYATNSYVADGRIAPGRTATFTVELDPTGSEVAIDYTYEVDTAAIASALLGETGTNEADIKITGAECKFVKSGEEDIVATITPNATSTVFTVEESLANVEAGRKAVATFTITWTNNDINTAIDTAEGVASYGTSNTAISDTLTIPTGKPVTFPVNVTASQHI